MLIWQQRAAFMNVNLDLDLLKILLRSYHYWERITCFAPFVDKQLRGSDHHALMP